MKDQPITPDHELQYGFANPAPSPSNNELREKLADIEHQRWADWQKYCHKVIRENVPFSKPLDIVLTRWDIQIMKPYSKLSDKEKASDMEQVDRYWPLIEAYVQQEVDKAIREARIDERKHVALDNYKGQTFSEATNYKAKFDKFIENNEKRIKQLKGDK